MIIWRIFVFLQLFIIGIIFQLVAELKIAKNERKIEQNQINILEEKKRHRPKYTNSKIDCL